MQALYISMMCSPKTQHTVRCMSFTKQPCPVFETKLEQNVNCVYVYIYECAWIYMCVYNKMYVKYKNIMYIFIYINISKIV